VTLLRREDARLLRGTGHFVDDVDRPGQLHVRIVRAATAHARIEAIGTDEAAALPGVHAVVTAADLGDLAPIPVRLGPVEGERHLQPVLAREAVRYVGEPVAAVVADDPYLAEDAAELVRVQTEELRLEPAECATLERRYGDVDGAFAGAAHVVAVDVRIGRHFAVPLECRGLLAEWDGEGLTIWGATKVPHFNRDVLARLLGLPAERIVMRRTDAGGGFGARGELYPEDVLVPWLACRLGRPVKWIEDRAENLVACNHSREQTRRVEGAFDAEGRLLALRDELHQDNGAYLRTHGVVVAELTLGMLPGPYRVPAYAGTAHVVLTHKTPCGTYRGPGRYEATFARERLLDAAAHELGIDRVALRRANLLTPEELPHERPLDILGHEVVIDSGAFGDLLDRTLADAGWDAWTEEAERLRGEGRLVGCGIGVFMEKSGGGDYETARVEVGADGRVRVASGAASLGQGIETMLARVVAGPLGVAPSDVDVVAGDTALVGAGVGSWASRSTVMAGGAGRAAAEAVADRARRVAATLLEADPGDIVLADGRASVAGAPARGLALADVAAACAPLAAARRGEPPGLAAERAFADAPMTYPYGVHLAQVEVDAETGGVAIRRYRIGYEVGRAIEPVLVRGQLVGGAAQGIGGALFEEFRYADSGQPLSVTFMEYLLPTAGEMPPVGTLVREDAPSAGNPLGAKGAGEGGAVGAGAALASAIDDALGRPGAVRELPVTPECARALVAGAGRPAHAR
jgi:carbon-monoxide dehydrogenase large subunit